MEPTRIQSLMDLAASFKMVAARRLRKFVKFIMFTVRKTRNVFSNIPLDQAHEQNTALIKGDGGAVGLTDNPGALRRWVVAEPEIARVIEEFNSHYIDRTQQIDT